MKNLTDSIINAVKRHIPFEHYRMFYFGSRVSGKAAQRSDIDIGIESSDKIPLDAIARIREELDQLPLLQGMDIVDFYRVSKDFSIEAKKNMEIIYEQ